MTELLTLTEAALRLRVSERTVKRRIKAGELRPKHIGRSVFVTDTEVERYASTLDRRLA